MNDAKPFYSFISNKNWIALNLIIDIVIYQTLVTISTIKARMRVYQIYNDDFNVYLNFLFLTFLVYRFYRALRYDQLSGVGFGTIAFFRYLTVFIGLILLFNSIYTLNHLKMLTIPVIILLLTAYVLLCFYGVSTYILRSINRIHEKEIKKRERAEILEGLMNGPNQVPQQNQRYLDNVIV